MKEKRLRGNVLIGALLLSMILGGCGSSGASSEMKEASSAQSYGTELATVNSAATYDEAVMEEAVNGEDLQVQDQDRKLITTMWITAESEDLTTLLAQVEAQVKALGGYISNSDINQDTHFNYDIMDYEQASTPSRASLTVRIPSEQLDAFLSSVTEESNITYQSKSVEDVTLTYVDLESHKKVLLAEEERLLELLELSETVEDMITVEDKLADVRYQLESMESQLRSYDNQIDYSTVYLTLEQVETYTAKEPKTVGERIATGFSENLKDVRDWLVDVFVWIVTHLPGLIVFALILWAVIMIISGLKKRKARKRQQKAEKVNGKRTIQSGIRDAARETERGQEYPDESSDRHEDRDHVEQAADDQK